MLILCIYFSRYFIRLNYHSSLEWDEKMKYTKKILSRSFVINVSIVQVLQRKVNWWLLAYQVFMYILLKRLSIKNARFTPLSCSVFSVNAQNDKFKATVTSLAPHLISNCYQVSKPKENQLLPFPIPQGKTVWETITSIQ